MLAIYRYPTLVLFAEGMGIASAAALVDSELLALKWRKAVHLYYKVGPMAVQGSVCMGIASAAALVESELLGLKWLKAVHLHSKSMVQHSYALAAVLV